MLSTIKKSSTLAETAYDAICDGISSGSLPMGMNVSEVFLAEQLGISRTSVRPAMQKLLDEGLLVQVSERVIKTFEINEEITYNIYQSRAVIESGLALSMTENVKPELISELEDLLLGMDNAIEEKNLEKFNKLDSQFHSCLVNTHATEDLKKLWRALVLKIDIVRNQTQLTWDSANKSQKEHREIIKYIKSSEAIKLAVSLKNHAYNQQLYLYSQGV